MIITRKYKYKFFERSKMLLTLKQGLSDTNGIKARSKEFLDIQATIECRLTLKRVQGMIITYSQMHRTE